MLDLMNTNSDNNELPGNEIPGIPNMGINGESTQPYVQQESSKPVPKRDEQKFREDENKRTVLDKLSDEKKIEISEFVLRKVDECYKSDKRQQWDKKRKTWENLYDDNLPPKSFPWSNCSNTNVPLISSKIENLAARQEATILGVTPTYIINGWAGTQIGDLTRIETYLDYQLFMNMDAQNILPQVFLETDKIGTAVTSIEWEYKTEKMKCYKDEDGSEKIVDVDFETKNSPTLNFVDLDDFGWAMDFKGWNIQKVPWLFEIKHLTPSTIAQRAKDKIYTDTDKLKSKVKGSDGQDKFLFDKDYYHIISFWCSFDIDDDGLQEKCLFYVDKDTGTLIRSEFNPYLNSRYPYIVWTIMRRANRIEGIGIAEMLEQTQLEINQHHNMRVDDGAMTICGGVIYRDGCGFDPTKDRIFPGFSWKATEPATDIVPMRLGSSGAMRSFQEEGLCERYADKRIGMSDLMGGLTDPRDPGAPGNKSQLLIGQSNIKVNWSIRHLQSSMSELAYWINELAYQFSPVSVEYLILGSDRQPLLTREGRIAKQDMNRDILRCKYIYNIRGQSMENNKESRQQRELFLFETTIGTMEKIMQIPDPNLQRFTLGMLKDLLYTYDKKDVDERIQPLNDAIEAMAQKVNQQQPQQEDGGMALLKQIAAQNEQGGEQSTEEIPQEGMV